MSDGNVTIQGLEFEIKANAGNSADAINKLSESLNKLKSAAKGGFGSLDKLSTNLTNLKTALSSLGDLDKTLSGLDSVSRKITDLSTAVSTFNQSGRMNGTAVNTVVNALTKLSNIKVDGNALKTIADALDVVKIKIDDIDADKIREVANALKELSKMKASIVGTTDFDKDTPADVPAVDTDKMGEQWRDYEETYAGIEDDFEDVTEATRDLVSANEEVAESANKAAEAEEKEAEETEETVSKFEKLKSVLKGVKTALNVFKSGLGVVGKLTGLSGFAGQMSTAISKIKQFTTSLGRIMMYRAVRFIISSITSGIKEGINNLYQYSKIVNGTFSQSMDNLASNAQYLKNSLGAMASPIIEALSPAIDFIVDKIVNLFNMINQIFAKLTGKSSYTVADKVSAEYKQAEKDVKNSTDKIKSYTMGIDELNIIDPNKGSSDGSGSNKVTPDYSSMFHTEEIDGKIGDFVDSIKKAFNDGNWLELGMILGDKVNSIFDSIPWEKIGTKFSEGVNGIVSTLYYMLDTIDFVAIGNDFATLMNSIFNTVDWSMLGALLIERLTSIGDTILGFFLNLDVVAVGNAVCDFFIGAFDEGKKWLLKWDWEDVANKLTTKVFLMYKEVKWGSLGNSFFAFMRVAFKSAGEATRGMFIGIGDYIYEWWKDALDEYDNWGEFAAYLFGKILDVLTFNDLKWNLEYNVLAPFVDGMFGTNYTEQMEEKGKGGFAAWVDGMLHAQNENPAKITPELEVEPVTLWTKLTDWFDNRTEGRAVKIPAEVDKPAVQQSVVEAAKPLKAKDFQIPASVKDDSPTWWSNVTRWWNGKASKGTEFGTAVKDDSSVWWGDTTRYWNTEASKGLDIKVNNPDDSGLHTWYNEVLRWWSNLSPLWLGIKLPTISLRTSTAKLLGKTFTYPSGFDIQWFAKGGILDGATLFGVSGNNFLGGGEAGREAVLPLDRNTEWMDKVADRVAQRQGNGYSEFRRALSDFYAEYMASTMKEMANDARRTADKNPSTIVNIGGRTLTDVVDAQRRANGYSFGGA